MIKEALIMSNEDNVATIVSESVEAGVTVNCETKKIKARGKIPFGHKIALSDIQKGNNIIKYGEVIGKALKDIREGDHAHIHNIKGLN